MAQNVDEKKTALDDGAEIYKQDRPVEERKSFSERWKAMDGKEKKAYFFDYMLKPIILGIIAVVILTLGIINVVTKAGRVYYRMSVTFAEYMDMDALEAEGKKLAKAWGVSGRQKFIVEGDVGEFTGNGGTNSATKLDNLVLSGAVDVLIGTEAEVAPIAEYCEVIDCTDPELAAMIPEESRVSTTFVDQNHPDRTETRIYGIRLKDTCLKSCISASYAEPEKLVVVFPQGDISLGYKDRDYEFIKYLFGK